MTMMEAPEILAIMSTPHVRARNVRGVALVALTRSMTRILWANRAGAALLSLAGAGPLAAPQGLDPAGTALRQVRGGARALATAGTARVLLRPSGQALGKPAVADLAIIECEGMPDGFVLMSVEGHRGIEEDAGSLANRLCEEAGGANSAVALVWENGSVPAELPHRQLAGFAEALDAFRGSAETWRRSALEQDALVLAKVAHEHVAVWIESRPPVAASPDAGTAPPGAPADGSPTVPAPVSTFTVKRRPLRGGRGKMDMSALLQRWHSREVTVPGAAAGTVQPDAPSSPEQEAHSPALEPAGPVAEGSSSQEKAPLASLPSGEASTAPAAVPSRLRSAWGARAASVGAPEAVDAAPPERAAENAPPHAGKPRAAAPAATGDAPSGGGDANPPASVEETLTDTGDGGSADGETPARDPEAAASPGVPAAGRGERSDPDASASAASEDLFEADARDAVPASPSVAPSETMRAQAAAARDALNEAAAAASAQPRAGGAPSGPAAAPLPPQPDHAAHAPRRLAEPSSESAQGAAPFQPRFDVGPVRFVWQIDREGRFRTLSPEFAAAVGPRSGAVIGRTFREVAQVFGFDGDGEVVRLLERRDTWSGRSIEWPVENSDRKVLIDLAALPVYARDRSFDGFRGFGIVRMSETLADPDRIGLILAGRASTGPEPLADLFAGDKASGHGAPAAASADDTAAPHEDEAGESRGDVLSVYEAEAPRPVFGRRAEAPRPAPRDARKVVDLEERRRSKDAVLSQAEEAAFRAIGQKLSDREDTARFGRAVLEASERLRDFADEEDGAAGRGEAVFTHDEADAGNAAPSAHRPAEAADFARAGEDGARAEPAGDAAGVSHPSPPAAEDASAEAFPRDGGHDINENDQDGAALPVGGGLLGELDEIFAQLPLPILVQMREDLVYANREFADLTGYSSIEALAQAGGLAHLFTDREDDQESGEMRIRRSNNSIVAARVHMQRAAIAGRSCLIMSFSPSPMASLAGRQAGSTAEAAANALREEIEELRTVLNTATDGVVLLDPAGRIRSMNGAAHALFGIAENDSAGRPFASLFAHESQKTALAYIETLREEGLAGILNDGREVIGRVAQGGVVPLFITVGRLTGERGWCAVIRDIAHWKRIEEDLTSARRQAEAASLHKSQFLANISHELRTPLNAIIGFADVMSTECFGPIGHERYLEYLGDIKRSGHHVLDLVNDLLDISKIEAGKLELSFEAVSLNEVVSEVVALMQPQANRERVIVRSNLPSTVPPVVADRRSIRQIALNLVANAIRFTPAGGQIVASTSYTNEGDVVLRFRDSGIGMTEREIEIALTPFQQVRSLDRGRGDGTGLGLPLTKAMAEANRAQFSIASTPGEGTVVEILFPSQRVLAD